MHEVGHVLGVGWADDTAIGIDEEVTIEIETEYGDIEHTATIEHEEIPKGMEVYSGDIDGDGFKPDATPEYVDRGDGVPNPRWSIMMRGTTNDTRDFPGMTADADQPVLAISIEELSTISFENVPMREEHIAEKEENP